MSFDESDHEFLRRLYPEVKWTSPFTSALTGPRCALVVDPKGLSRTHTWKCGAEGRPWTKTIEGATVELRIEDGLEDLFSWRTRMGLEIGVVVTLPIRSLVLPDIAVWSKGDPRKVAIEAWGSIHGGDLLKHTKHYKVRIVGQSDIESAIAKALLGDPRDLKRVVRFYL